MIDIPHLTITIHLLRKITLEVPKVMYNAHFSAKSFFPNHLSATFIKKKKWSLKYQIWYE